MTITAPGFDPLMQNQRPGLLLSRGKVYIGYASHCDKAPYHGFLISYDAKSLRQTGVFNTSPQAKRKYLAVWAGSRRRRRRKHLLCHREWKLERPVGLQRELSQA